MNLWKIGQLTFIHVELVGYVFPKQLVERSGDVCELRNETCMKVAEAKEAAESRLVCWWFWVLQTFDVNLTYLECFKFDNMT